MRKYAPSHCSLILCNPFWHWRTLTFRLCIWSSWWPQYKVLIVRKTFPRNSLKIHFFATPLLSLPAFLGDLVGDSLGSLEHSSILPAKKLEKSALDLKIPTDIASKISMVHYKSLVGHVADVSSAGILLETSPSRGQIRDWTFHNLFHWRPSGMDVLGHRRRLGAKDLRPIQCRGSISY